MLQPETIAAVKSTVSILQEKGGVLTEYFYKRMFKHNPEVLPLFNSANQHSGTQQQALASAICAYAANIDNLDALGSAVELIAHKHVSLRIKPEHYPIVGENLLESIKEVLGDGATEDVLVAWGEAYTFLADILIRRETQLYEEQSKAPGGWTDFKDFKVVRKERESDVVTSFYLEPEDGSMPPLFKPGQYITVRVPAAQRSSTMRNYSLSDKPGQRYFRISIKREEGSNGCPMGYVSNKLHSSIEVGQLLEIAPPCGEFYLDTDVVSDRPLVLLAAGVGVTPILSILLSALEVTPEREIIFIQASLHEGNQAFKHVIEELVVKHSNLKRHYCYSDAAPSGIVRVLEPYVSEGLVDAGLIEKVVGAPDADYYFCGPKPFMVNTYHNLLKLGAPANQIHFEFFGPRQEIEGDTVSSN